MVDNYIWVSVAVGLAQVLDCVIYLSGKGRISKTSWVFSVTEWVWGGVSLYVLMQEYTGIPTWLPSVYVAHLILWTVYGVVVAVAMVRRNEDSAELTVARGEAIAGGLFGLVFAAAAFSLT